MFPSLPIRPQTALFCGLSLLPLIAANAQQAAPLSATISVDARAPIGKVPPLLFGQNLEVGDGFQIFGEKHTLSGKNGGGVWNPATHQPVGEVLDAVKGLGVKMTRYPGGCLTHNWQWKQTIGPLENRPNFEFGLDEYLGWCRAANTEPLITVSDYSGTPADAADLVEYLNAPATPEHPWAQKRAANGHAAPYEVKYFEMGNESDHGNHEMQPPRKWSATDYAEWFNDLAAKMKAVDPTIQIGGLMATGGAPDNPWNRVVLTQCRASLDYVVIHKYAIGMNSPQSPIALPADQLMRACMAQAEQFEAMLAGYRAKVLELTGKPLPLALTEYNALFVQPKDDLPLPFRYSLGAALFSADYLRVLMRPESNVFNADYWQLIGGYWGLTQPQRDGSQKPQAAYYLFRLWGQHFGSELVATTVETPHLPFEGLGARVRPAAGEKYRPETLGATNLFQNALFKPKDAATYRTEMVGDGFKATFANFSGEKFPLITTLKGNIGQSLAVSFEARSDGDLTGATLGLGLVDARGWAATKSGIAVEGAETSRTWTHFEGKLTALPDSPGADLSWRLRAATGAISGTFEVRNLEIHELQPEQFPAYAAITSASSLSPDGKTLYVMVFNKHSSAAISTSLDLRGFAARTARRWSVTGPSLEATNRGAQMVSEGESGVEIPVAAGKPLSYLAPAHSMTAWEFTR